VTLIKDDDRPGQGKAFQEARKLEAGKGNGELTGAPIVERILKLLDFGRKENVEDIADSEQELIDNVDWHNAPRS